MPFCLHFEHRPTVLLVEEGDALDQAGEALGELLCGLLQQNGGRLGIKGGGKLGLPIMMHQRFDLALVKVANLFQ